MSDIRTIGFIGTGIMGGSMAGHLQAAGYKLRVHNRTKDKARKLLEAGAVWCGTPAEAAEGADAVITIVGFPADVEAVILGAAGALGRARKGAIIADMTTSEPSLARRVFAQARARGVGALDAPVSGGDVGARNATLAIMVGGELADFERMQPVFQAMGKTVVHVGPPGAGQHCKMVNQILIAGTMLGLAEAIVYGRKARLDMHKVLGVVSTGAAGSAALTNLGPRVLAGDFEPGFIVEHFIKDMGIALKEARDMRLGLEGLELVKRLYDAAASEGLGRKGTQVLAKSIAARSGVEL